MRQYRGNPDPVGYKDSFKPEEYQVDKLDLGELMKALDELEKLNKKHDKLTFITATVVGVALGASLMTLIFVLARVL